MQFVSSQDRQFGCDEETVQY